MSALTDAKDWYHRRAIAYLDELPGMHPSNIDNFLMQQREDDGTVTDVTDERLSVEGTVIVVRCPSPVIRSVIDRWASEGERPPKPFTGIQTRNL